MSTDMLERLLLLLLVGVFQLCSSNVQISETEYKTEFFKLTRRLQASSASPFGSASKTLSSAARYNIFKSRYSRIKELNTEGRSFEAVSNEFAVMSDEELGMFTGLNISLYRPDDVLSVGGPAILGSSSEIPSSIDWKDKGHVTETKAQGTCGSCWAFAAVAALESRYAIKTGTLKMISEQQVLDCTYIDYGFDGCQGGWMGDAFKQIRTKLGNKLATSETYSYTGRAADTCVTNIFTKKGSNVVNALVAANLAVNTYTIVDFNDNEEKAPYEANLARAVSTGPVTVAIEVVNSMYAYGAGVYDETNCKNQVNHAVTVVGYDAKVFVIKNSWGSAWGEKGYINFDRKISNQCFIGQYPEYPNLVLTGEDEDDSEVDNPCDPNPCQNRGKCKVVKKDGSSTFKCKCKKNFKGSLCQDKTSKCQDKSSRCPKDKNDRRCLAGKRFVKKRCKLSCGFCYL